jgi:predicted RNA-binding protein with PIN domain
LKLKICVICGFGVNKGINMARVILIDGNNLIHRTPELKTLVNYDFTRCREKLIEILKQYIKIMQNYEIMLIFDNKLLLGNTTDYGRLKVIYIDSRYQDADTFIKEKVVKKDRFYIVVSSDNSVFHFCENAGAVSIKSEEFIKRVKMRISGKSYAFTNNGRKGTGSKKGKKRFAVLNKL